MQKKIVLHLVSVLRCGLCFLLIFSCLPIIRCSSCFLWSTSAKRPRKQSGSSSSSSTEATCACTSGCNSQRCKCVKANGKCSGDCKCTACKNPLNVLGNYGVDVAAAKEDKCLMQNIFRVILNSYYLLNVIMVLMCKKNSPRQYGLEKDYMGNSKLPTRLNFTCYQPITVQYFGINFITVNITCWQSIIAKYKSKFYLFQ